MVVILVTMTIQGWLTNAVVYKKLSAVHCFFVIDVIKFNMFNDILTQIPKLRVSATENSPLKTEKKTRTSDISQQLVGMLLKIKQKAKESIFSPVMIPCARDGSERLAQIPPFFLK